MIRVARAALLCLFALPAILGAQEKYIASYAGFAGFQAPLWSAKDFGFLAKYGVNTDLVMIPGSARGAQALLGGSIHFGQIDGTALIAAINQGADLVFVASSLNKFPFSLVAQKNIRQPKDLIGKKVGIVSLGGAHEVSLILALREWNIPRQSVTLLASGPAANRLVALSSGALDATLLAPPETGEAARMGLPTLAHMTELKAAYFPMNAIATRRSFVEKNRDVVKRFLQAYAEGIHQFMTSKEKSLASADPADEAKKSRRRRRDLSVFRRYFFVAAAHVARRHARRHRYAPAALSRHQVRHEYKQVCRRALDG